MQDAPPTVTRSPRRPVRRGLSRLLIALALLLPAAPLTGCVEVSRTERGRFGNPLESYSSGPRNTFDAENYRPPDRTPAQKPWYQRIFDW